MQIANLQTTNCHREREETMRTEENQLLNLPSIIHLSIQISKSIASQKGRKICSQAMTEQINIVDKIQIKNDCV